VEVLTPDQFATLRGWFVPERPGPLVGLHVLNTGHGTCYADRWPDPRAILVDSGANLALHGAVDALSPADLRGKVRGFVDAPPAWEPLLRTAFSNVTVWPRVILELPSAVAFEPTACVRRLTADDTPLVAALSPDAAWITRTWDGAAALASSGYAWGAIVQDRLVSVAVSFFVASGYEDLGVVTEPAFRRQGLSAACAAALCADIQSRGRRPSWTTSPDNTGSLAVAHKLGFVHVRDDRLYVINVPTPRA
jgi:RimJ/RimL family protein N-acetyltransferase